VGFTEKYNVERLVYYETFNYVNDAIKREKVLKEWNRKWKIMLIEKTNSEWKDLLYEIASEEEIELMREVVLSNACRES
jgi:putative endonuclease